MYVYIYVIYIYIYVYIYIYIYSGLRGVTGTERLHSGGGTRTTESPLLLRRMRAAFCLGCHGEAFAFCLLRCCCIAVPCPLTPGEQTGQRPSPLLMLTLCRRNCPKAWLTDIPGPLGPPSCCGPPQAAPGPRGSSEARTTYIYIYIYIYVYIYIYIYIYIYTYIYMYIYIYSTRQSTPKGAVSCVVSCNEGRQGRGKRA